MSIARLGVVVVLCVGLLVFGIFAVNDLADGLKPPTPNAPAETLALGASDDPPMDGDFLSARTADQALGPQYIPMEEDPAGLPPYPGAERDVCQRLEAGERYEDEQARYVVQGASLEQVMRHYQQAAADAGFVAHDSRPVQDRPGSLITFFSRGDQTFKVAVVPINPGPLPPPPALPPEPKLSITVQFRYPIASQP